MPPLSPDNHRGLPLQFEQLQILSHPFRQRRRGDLQAHPVSHVTAADSWPLLVNQAESAFIQMRTPDSDRLSQSRNIRRRAACPAFQAFHRFSVKSVVFKKLKFRKRGFFARSRRSRDCAEAFPSNPTQTFAKAKVDSFRLPAGRGLRPSHKESRRSTQRLRKSRVSVYLKNASSACSPRYDALIFHLALLMTRAARAIWGSSAGA